MGYPISDNRDWYLKRKRPKEDGVEGVNDVMGERIWREWRSQVRRKKRLVKCCNTTAARPQGWTSLNI
jgi:hypothetical protein